MLFSLLWIPATLLASLTQTARNAVQSALTTQIGMVAATQVRFLYGLPFACLFLLGLVAVSREPIPSLNITCLGYLFLGAGAQILATALMLIAMQQRSFAVAYAYIKTEPILVALFSALLLGDTITPLMAIAIVLATAGVLLCSVRLNRMADLAREVRPALIGILSGAFFGASAVGFRGAILHLETGSFYMRATTVLVWGLTLQCLLLACFMAVANRQALGKTLSVWRQSLAAGCLGAVASQFWFLGFALTSAANVRTLALLEIPMAALISRKIFKEHLNLREGGGMTLILMGVGLLLYASR